MPTCRRLASRATHVRWLSPASERVEVAGLRHVLHLSDTIVQLWAKATLSVQLCDEGWRLILHSPPQGWALAVSLGGQITIVLGEKAQTMKITCADAESDRQQMAIVPFEQSP
jgi:hypothetical protein